MTRDELLALKEAGITNRWPVDSAYAAIQTFSSTPYPFVEVGSSAVKFAVASVYMFEKTEHGKSKCHSVVLACAGKNSFFLWCGDAFLEGKIKKAPTKLERVSKAAACATPHRRPEAASAMDALYGAHIVNAGCNFWARWRDGIPCKHAHTFLAARDESALQDLCHELEAEYDAYTSEKGVVAEATAAKHPLADLAFRVPVLLEGDRGAGKTHDALEFAKESGCESVLIQGNESMESIDLLGYSLHTSAFGPGVWKDGRLAEAFRIAARRKVVLIVDELLRIPQRQLSVFLAALTAFEGKYRLNTGRIVDVVDGIGREECIECPTENLCVIATTNVGAEYAVDAIDPALAERFHIVRKDTDRNEVIRIVSKMALERGFKPNVANQVATFLDKMRELLKQNYVVRAPTTRTLTRALTLAGREEDVQHWLEQSSLTWVGRDVDGKPLVEQMESVSKVIRAAFK